jgi:hypothetical protein
MVEYSGALTVMRMLPTIGTDMQYLRRRRNREGLFFQRFTAESHANVLPSLHRHDIDDNVAENDES